ncbi:MAG: chromate transporter [Oscillospiraceae bacterium]|nr:chromate transporter [Oscillospiraceae bacterium]
MTVFLNLFFIFFRIGLIGFGGGYAIMSIIMQESVNLGVTVEQFADLTALHLVIPGPIAINAATFAGYQNSGFFGSLTATLGISAPCFIIVLTVMFFLEKFKKSQVVEGLFFGVRPAAIGLIAAASLTIAREVILVGGVTFRSFFANILSDPLSVFSPMCLLIFVASLICLAKFKINPIAVTLLAGAVGAAVSLLIA